MPDGVTSPPAPVIVTLPGEIDVTNAADAEAQITVALGPGVTVVIADLTGTSFCDFARLNHLIQASHQAAANGTELRLVIFQGGPVARVIELTGIGRHVPVYPPSSRPLTAARRPARPAGSLPCRKPALTFAQRVSARLPC